MGANRLSHCEPPRTDRADKVLDMPMADVVVADARIVSESPVRLRDRLIKVINSVLME